MNCQLFWCWFYRPSSFFEAVCSSTDVTICCFCLFLITASWMCLCFRLSVRESKHLKMLSGIFSFKFRISLTLCWRSVVSCCCSPLAERAWSRILWTEIESLTRKFTVQQRQTASTNHPHARTDNRVRRWRPRLSRHVTNSMNIVTNCYIQLVYASPVWGFAAFVCCI